MVYRVLRSTLLAMAVSVGGCAEGDASMRPGGRPGSSATAGSSGAGGSGGSSGRDGLAGSGATTAVGDPGGDYDVGHVCPTPGETRDCCQDGTQTCSSVSEFATWGPCLVGGQPVDCRVDSPPYECGTGEFAKYCDGGMPPPLPCGDGEFGPDCVDGGPPLPPLPGLCSDITVNNEPEILAAFSPANGESVGLDGQIKVWITDECPAFLAPNEQIDAATGKITVPGDRVAVASDGYLFEPALYIAPETAETGGTPHFPQWVKGKYNNMPTAGPFGMFNPFLCAPFAVVPTGPSIDPPPPGAMLNEAHNTEFIWDVAALGLAAGTYIAEFVIHDGDLDRAVGCVTITIRAPD